MSKKKQKVQLEIAARVLSGFIATGLYEDVDHNQLIKAAASLARALMKEVRKGEKESSESPANVEHIFYTIK